MEEVKVIEHIRVLKVERRRRALRTHNKGKDENNKAIWEVEYEDIGWFVSLEGSHESMHWGFEETPRVKVNDRVTIRIQVE